METNSLEVVHNKDKHRFEIRVGEHFAVLEYFKTGNVLTFTHTGVPTELEGQGIGGRLVLTALSYAREQNFKVVPLCSFVATYIRRHPEYEMMVK